MFMYLFIVQFPVIPALCDHLLYRWRLGEMILFIHTSISITLNPHMGLVRSKLQMHFSFSQPPPQPSPLHPTPPWDISVDRLP